MTDTKKPDKENVTIPVGGPTDNEKKSSSITDKKKWMAVGFSICLAIVVLAIVLPLVLNKPTDKNEAHLRPKNDTEIVEISQHFEPPFDKEENQFNSPEEQETEKKSNFFEDPFSINLPNFSKDILQGYNNEQDFDDDMVQAVKLTLNNAIKRNLKVPGYENVGLGHSGGGNFLVPETAMMAMADTAAAPLAAASAPEKNDVTDFGTNNQEKGVDEADIIKADENFVYGAYGDYLVVWDSNGNKITQVQMPEILQNNLANPISSQKEASNMATKSMIAPPFFYQPKPHIESLMLSPGYLTVFVSGYGSSLRQKLTTDRHSSIMYEYLGTQIRIYKTSKLPTELELIGTKDVNGRYLDARLVKNAIHLATTSTLDIYSTLIAPLDRDQYFPGLSDEEYLIAARQASEKNMAAFVDQLHDELSASGMFPDMLQINRWQTETKENSQVDDVAHGDGVVDSIGFITSFDVTQDLASKGELTVSTSSFIAPSSWIHMYATENKLVLATQGWNWNSELEYQEQSTYLLGLTLDGSTTKFISVGSVPGHLLNSFALDIVGNDLRVATTVRKRQVFRPILFAEDAIEMVSEPAPEKSLDELFVEDAIEMVSEPAPEEILDEDKGMSSILDELAANTEPTEIIAADLDMLVEASYVDKSTVHTEPALLPVISTDITKQVIPVQLPETPLPPSDELVEESSTENYVIVLELESNVEGYMVERGRVQIGEKHESITSVRFFDDVAYVVTFERTDPFYVIDLDVPKKLGEFKLNGFSSYLHPMTPDNKMLIGIGQNATDEGRVTGLMITIFNATIPENPVAVVSYTVENELDRYSGSDAEWEHKSFRYINGKLIVPLYEHYNTVDEATGNIKYDSFQGFVIFNITTESISEHYRVSHKSLECHYCGGWLPARSFIYDGNLMTTKNSVVASTNLESGEKLWSMDIVINGEDNSCCPYHN